MAASSTIADRAAEKARRTFVGRGAECAAFARILAAPEPEANVVHLFGPGGIGKTTLLRRFAGMATEAGAAVVLLDGTELDTAPQAFAGILAMILGGDPRESRADGRRTVILIDGIETLGPLLPWLRREFLPALSADTVLVLAGRGDPGPAWRNDPALSPVSRFYGLRGLTPDESSDFLARRGVPAERRDDLVTRSFGHPLALTLAAEAEVSNSGPRDRGPAGSLLPVDLARTLLLRLVAEVTPSQRRALEVAAHAFRTTEAMLADAVDPEEAAGLFAWLAGQPYVDSSSDGLFPHDIAREVIHQDHRWRDPAGFTAMHRRIRSHYGRRIAEGGPPERMRALRDTVWLHRLNPIMAEFFRFRFFGRVHVEPATAGDRSAILALVERHEGEASRKLAEHWLRRQPRAFFVARSESEPVAGMIVHLDLGAVESQDIETDPALRAIAPTLERQAVREGETAILSRFNIAADSHQAPSPAATAMQIHSYQQWMTTPRLAWTFLATVAAVPWDDLMRYLDFAPVEGGTFSVGRLGLRVFGHDWRQVPPMAWFARMEDREIDAEMRPEAVEPSPPELLVLSRPSFSEAVREALKGLHDDSALSGNPLLRSRLLADRRGAGRPEGLRATVLAAARTLREQPRAEKFYKAVDLTYLTPVGTQEAAAERLGLPFGTYRYRLNTAVDRIVDTLWSREVTPMAEAAE